MHKLCGYCERAMVMYWNTFQDRPDMLNQLSSGALQRIAKGLNGSLLASTEHPLQSVLCIIENQENTTHYISILMCKTSLHGSSRRRRPCSNVGHPPGVNRTRTDCEP